MDPSHVQQFPITAAVITVSTSRTEKEDTSGSIIKELLAKQDIPTIFYSVIPDTIPAIRTALTGALTTCNCVIINGGTGITHDDCTIEAVEPFLEKKLDGFGELFRMKSYEDIGTRTVLSRAIAGIIDKKAVFCIPGSTGAVTLAMEEIILHEIRHILTHAGK